MKLTKIGGDMICCQKGWARIFLFLLISLISLQALHTTEQCINFAVVLHQSTEDFTSSISRKFTTRPTHGARSTGRSQKQKAQDAEKVSGIGMSSDFT